MARKQCSTNTSLLLSLLTPTLFCGVPWFWKWVMLDGSRRLSTQWSRVLITMTITSPTVTSARLKKKVCLTKAGCSIHLWPAVQHLIMLMGTGLISCFSSFLQVVPEPILNFYFPFIRWIKKYRSLLNFLCHPHSGAMLISVLSVISSVHIAKVSACYRLLNIFLSL